MSDARPRTYEVLGILMTFHAFPADVQGKYCLVEALVPPGAGAPPNHHAGETEAFFMLEGTAEFMVNGEVIQTKAGDHVAIPDGAVHAFSATGDTPARMLILNAPGNMHDAFFTGLGTPLPDGTRELPPPDGPPDIPAVIAMAGKVGMELVLPEGAPA